MQAAAGTSEETMQAAAGTSEEPVQAAAGRTEITLVTGERYLVEGQARDVERTILDAARGSIMQFAWLTEAGNRDELGVNPEHVVLLRSAGPG